MINPKSVNVIDPPSPDREREIEAFMWENGNLKLYSADDYARLLTPMEVCWFCWYHGLYQLPTTELINHIKLRMVTKKFLPSEVLEIGAGAGQIGRHLGIRMTDSKLQEDPGVQLYYQAVQQPLVKYGPDVEKIDANSAVLKYRPKMVIACWVTEFPLLIFGVKEKLILKEVDEYLFVGNRVPHEHKSVIQGIPGDYYPWLVSRSFHSKENRIWIINGGR